MAKYSMERPTVLVAAPEIDFSGLALDSREYGFLQKYVLLNNYLVRNCDEINELVWSIAGGYAGRTRRALRKQKIPPSRMPAMLHLAVEMRNQFERRQLDLEHRDYEAVVHMLLKIDMGRNTLYCRNAHGRRLTEAAKTEKMIELLSDWERYRKVTRVACVNRVPIVGRRLVRRYFRSFNC